MARPLAFINPRLTTTNVGDVFIEDSAKRILVYDAATSLDVDPRRPVTDETIERINGCAAAVIVGTNLWYRQLLRPGRWTLTVEQLRRIRVPIIPVGVGTTRHEGEGNDFDDDTRAQLRIIHGSCPHGSARDPRTAEALAEAGIDNVIMTGCPTLYRSLAPTWALRPRPDPGHSSGGALRDRVVVTVRKGQRANVRALLKRLRARGLAPVVAAQQPKDVSFRRAVPLVHPGTTTVHAMDIEPYLRLVRESVGAIGWRLHGNMLHLAHGNPAVFFANCSRAASFCAAFGLPCIVGEDHTTLDPRVIESAVDRLVDRTGFEPLAASYAHYRSEMVRFLDANGLEHRLTADVAAVAAGA